MERKVEGAVPIYTLWWRGAYGYDYEFEGAFTTREYAEASVDDLSMYDVEEWWLYFRPKKDDEDVLV